MTQVIRAPTIVGRFALWPARVYFGSSPQFFVLPQFDLLGYAAMASFDQFLDDFYSKPRTLEAQLLATNAMVIQDACAVSIPALANILSLDCQKMISYFVGNTPATCRCGLPLSNLNSLRGLVHTLNDRCGRHRSEATAMVAAGRTFTPCI